MAKSQKAYEREHTLRVAQIQRDVERIFMSAAKEASGMTDLIHGLAKGQPFSFKDFPATRKRLNDMRKRIADSLISTITSSIDLEWSMADEKNDSLIRQVFGKRYDEMGPDRMRKYIVDTARALREFHGRRIDGLSLSDRVWNYTNQFQTEIEFGLGLSISRGQDAATTARSLQQYLKHPDKLFRRVRDEYGQLHLSKAAKAFHPGTGVYRSSFMNARRLAATETNIAYRTADKTRRDKLDFVVGIKIELSNNHTCLGSDGKPHEFYDICDELAGNYPKDFVFVGWHPHCRCHTLSILKTQDELFRDMDGVDRGSVNAVNDVPPQFKRYVRANRERIEAADERGKTAYWVRDNRAYVNAALGIDAPEPQKPTIQERAAARHAARTYEEALQIRLRWEDRKQFSYEQIDNMEEWERILGMKRGFPMDFSMADEKHANPGYGTDRGYGVNCQTCVPAFEMRRRGFDITALPNMNGDVWKKLQSKGIWWQDLFTDNDGKRAQMDYLTTYAYYKGIQRKTTKVKLAFLKEKLQTPGMYQIYCKWKGSSAHVFCAEVRKDGSIFYFDPQSGGQNVDKYIDASGPELGVMRIDDKLINPKIADLIFKVNR